MGEHKCKLEDAFQIADFFLRLAWVKRNILPRESEALDGEHKCKLPQGKERHGMDVTQKAFSNA